MTTVSIEVGAVTSSSARVIARITGTTPRLAVSAQPDLSGPVYFTPDSTASDGAAAFTATGLNPTTQYYYAIEDGTLDLTKTGKFPTHAPIGTPWSHTIATYGDAGLAPVYPGSGSELIPTRISNAPTFDTIRLANPLMAVCLGDRAYYDLGPDGNHGVVGGGSLSNYRRMYTDLSAQSNQARLVREIPSQYMYDNHDYGLVGAFADGDHPDKANAAQAYRERVPHYPTPESSGSPYQSWQVGRVLYILNDTRYSRSASGVPDGPGKTMLGQAQLDWMFDLLQTTTAEALVWLMPTPWLHDDGGLHHWGSFTYERDLIIEFLTTTPVPASAGARMWAQSLVQVTPDIHALGLCSPGHNGLGGFPVMLTAAVDATPHLGNEAVYDLGYQGGRDQWGTVGIADDGDQITITLTGWSGSAPWGSQQLTIDTTAVLPPTDPTPTPGAAAAFSDTVAWYACDLVTGAKLARLSMLTGSFGRALSSYTQAQLTLPLPLDGPGALGALAWQVLQVPSTMYVAVVNEVPAWAGMLLKVSAGSDGKASLGLVSLEGYLARRYVGAHDWTGTNQLDQALIAAGLVADANTEGIGLIVDAPLTGIPREREYHDDENATVYSRLQELASVADGPEWTIDLEWTDAKRTHVRKIFRLRQRIGVTVPQATLSSTSDANASYAWTIDYSEGRGANDILAYSSGEGTARPVSQHIRANDQIASGVPRFEYRWQPSSSIKNTTVLNEHATRKLYELASGTESVTVDCVWNADEARLGVDWNLGDTVQLALTGHLDPLPRIVTGRVMAYTLDPEAETVTPSILLES